MKKVLIGLLTLVSVSAFAGMEFSAKEIIDRGNYVEVIEPHVVGCASGECYGGTHRWYLKPRYNKNKVCKKLGFKKYIRGSKVVGQVNIHDRYSRFVYHVAFRTGYPGSPEGGRQVKSIESIECKK